ncbi:MAG: hypothetical protein C4314_06720 [Thermoflexus sp.]
MSSAVTAPSTSSLWHRMVSASRSRSTLERMTRRKPMAPRAFSPSTVSGKGGHRPRRLRQDLPVSAVRPRLHPVLLLHVGRQQRLGGQVHPVPAQDPPRCSAIPARQSMRVP